MQQGGYIENGTKGGREIAETKGHGEDFGLTSSLVSRHSLPPNEQLSFCMAVQAQLYCTAGGKAVSSQLFFKHNKAWETTRQKRRATMTGRGYD